MTNAWDLARKALEPARKVRRPAKKARELVRKTWEPVRKTRKPAKHLLPAYLMGTEQLRPARSGLHICRSSNKPVTHWTPERQDQKLFNTHTGKTILSNIHYAQLNYIHMRTYFIIITPQPTGKIQITRQCQPGRSKIYKSTHYSKIKLHFLLSRNGKQEDHKTWLNLCPSRAKPAAIFKEPRKAVAQNIHLDTWLVRHHTLKTQDFANIYNGSGKFLSTGKYIPKCNSHANKNNYLSTHNICTSLEPSLRHISSSIKITKRTQFPKTKHLLFKQVILYTIFCKLNKYLIQESGLKKLKPRFILFNLSTAGKKSLFNDDKCAWIGKESAGAGKKSSETGKKSAGTSKKIARTGKLSPAGIPTGSRTAVTGNIWTAYIRISRSSNKPVTHWKPERQGQKLLNTHTGKYILFSIYYAQLNYIHTLTHFIIITHQPTGKIQIARQCQSEKCKIFQSIHYSKIKIHFLFFRKSAGTGKKSAGTGKKSMGTGKKNAGTGKKSVGTGKKSAGTGKTSPAGIPTGNRTAVTGKNWTAYIRISRSSNKPVTHWTPERQDQKLLNTHTGKHIPVVHKSNSFNPEPKCCLRFLSGCIRSR